MKSPSMIGKNAFHGDVSRSIPVDAGSRRRQRARWDEKEIEKTVNAGEKGGQEALEKLSK